MLKLVKKLTFSNVFWIFFYLLIFGLLLKNSFSYLDPDLGWHLKVGESIYQSHEVPHINNYDYTFTGRWVDHEWLINLVSYKIYDSVGYVSLNIFFSLLIIISLILLNILVRKIFKKASYGLIAFVQLVGVLASLPHFGVRMQEFNFLFFIIELLIIEEYQSQKRLKTLFYLPPLFYLWANIHGSFLFGLAILIIWLLIKISERILFPSRLNKYFDFSNQIENKKLKTFFIFSVFSFLLTLITPYGQELYSFLRGYSNTFYLKAIQEWLPQSAFPFNYWQLVYLAFSAAILLIYFCSLKKLNFKKINFWHFSLAILLGISAFKSRRNFPLFFVSSVLLFIPLISSIFTAEQIKKISLRKELKYFLLFAVALTAASNFLSIKFVNNPFNSFCSVYPCGAVNFLKSSGQYQGLNVFNEYNWGGYLIWTYPEKKLFIDGRLPQVEYKGQTFMEEYYNFLRSDSNYSQKLSEYNINLALLKTSDDKIVAKKWEQFLFWIKDKDLSIPHYLRRYIESSSDWQKIYSDKTASVYLRVR